MKGLIRALLTVVGVFGILVVMAVVYITTFFDPNDLKPRLVQAVREQSGLELRLDGPLSWSFYPRIGVSVADAEAWLPQQPHEQEPFVGFDRAEISVAFTPLLTGDVAIDGLILDGMRLNLVRDADGRGNWQTLLDRLAENDAQDAPAQSPREPSSSGSVTTKRPGLSQGDDQPVAFAIASVEVDNSRVHYVDRRYVDPNQGDPNQGDPNQTGDREGKSLDGSDALDVTLDNVSLTGTNVSPQAPFPVKLTFDVEGAAPRLDGNVTFNSQMRMDLAAERYTFEKVTLDGRIQLPEIAEQAQNLSLKIATLTADTRSRQYRAEDVQLGATLYHSRLEEAPLSLTLDLDAEADLEAQTASLDNVALTGDDGLDLTGRAALTQIERAPSYTGEMTLAPLALRDWLMRLGLDPQAADPEALTNLTGKSTFQGDLQRIALDDLQLTLDDTRFEGSLAAGFDGRSFDVDLAGDHLDLDAYLAPTPASGSESESDNEQSAWLHALGVTPAMAAVEQVELLPVAWLGELEQQTRLTFESLGLKGAEMDNVTLEASGGSGRQRVDALTADLYGGSVDASGSLDLRQAPIQLSFTERLEGVDVAPLYKALSGEDSPLRGTLDLQGDFDSSTNTPEGLKQNLNGQAALRIDEGAMLGVNVSRQLCTAVAALQGRESTREWSEDTPFDRLRASMTVTNGVGHSDDIDIAIPGVALNGKGDVNLVTRRLDYRAAARFTDTADEAACPVGSRLARIEFPIRCQGRLGDAPNQWCGVDREALKGAVADLAQREVKSRAGEEVDRALDDALDEETRQKIDDRLGEGASQELGDRIRGLFK